MMFDFFLFIIFQDMRMLGENTEYLHLTLLQRESAGAYSCGAINTQGETRSTTIILKVQCEYIFTKILGYKN